MLTYTDYGKVASEKGEKLKVVWDRGGRLKINSWWSSRIFLELEAEFEVV